MNKQIINTFEVALLSTFLFVMVLTHFLINDYLDIFFFVLLIGVCYYQIYDSIRKIRADQQLRWLYLLKGVYLIFFYVAITFISYDFAGRDIMTGISLLFLLSAIGILFYKKKYKAVGNVYLYKSLLVLTYFTMF